MIRETTLCPNILNAIRQFARVSKFRSVQETKQAQNKVEILFYNLADLSVVCKAFFSNRFSQYDLIVNPNPPSPAHVF